MERKRLAAFKILAVLTTELFLHACGGNADYSPKPRGYFRIVFPEKAYQPYTEGCPFTFDYPKYTFFEPDKSRNAQPCWVNMQYPQFNATLHLTYQPITSKKEFNELTEDAHKLSFKHTVKATGINTATIYYPDRNVYGIYYSIDGNTASSAQFYLTDSTRHYLRGALYFNSEPRLDSVQPVLTFIKKDVDVLIKTLKWKN